LSLPGLYALRPVPHAPCLADSLRLGDDDARRLSPALWPAPKQGRLYTVAGGDESEEFIRQNALIREAWGEAVVPVCKQFAGRTPFSIVDALADPAHALHARAVELLAA